MFGPRIWRVGGTSDPLSEVQRLQRDVNSLFAGVASSQGVDYPAINVQLGVDDVIVTAEIPGLESDKTDISITRDVLTISGLREPEILKEGENYHRQERTSGRFTRTLQLPFMVDSGKVVARYEKGILSITLPRAEQDKPHKIAVKSE